MQKMQDTISLVLMCMEKHGDVAKAIKVSPYPFCILKIINKFSNVLMFLQFYLQIEM